MKSNLLEQLQEMLQAEASRVCKKVYGLPFDLEVGDLRSEDGYFKADVRVRIEKGRNEPPVSMELVRSLISTVEQNVEEKYQGLRFMLLPKVKKKPAVRQRRAS